MEWNLTLRFVFSFAALTLTLPIFGNVEKIRTSFGSCPARSAGSFVLKVSKEFDSHHSMIKVKKKILNEELMQRHYISKYNIKFDPVTENLIFNLQCADAVARIQGGKTAGADSYEGILVQGGKIFDPVYEMLLRDSKKLTTDLPVVSVATNEIDEKKLKDISSALESLPADIYKVVSEIILDKNGEVLVIILNEGIKQPTSFFMNDRSLITKFEKLTQMVRYFQGQKAQPLVVNMHNEKKVVVKFGN
jgi:hypothetical protein